MKKSNDVVITTPMRSIKVDRNEINTIIETFNKQQRKIVVIPKGYYTRNEYMKMTSCTSHEVTNRLLKEMIDNGKITRKYFTHYNEKGRSFQVPYYKLN